jgi:hypothetical protein
MEMMRQMRKRSPKGERMYVRLWRSSVLACSLRLCECCQTSYA